MRISFLYRTKL